jgi:hypothetical protein
MRRDQLEHAIRTACQITGLTEVIIVGSQAILGTFAEDELPFYATRSLEIDVLPIADDDGEIVRLADVIDGVAQVHDNTDTVGAANTGIRRPGVCTRRRACRGADEVTDATPVCLIWPFMG